MNQEEGTLAIDLGNSTTVVAFQNELSHEPELLDLPPISRAPGEIPSLIWDGRNENQKILVGQEVLRLALDTNFNSNICSDFKRWIGSPKKEDFNDSPFSPEESGEILINRIWETLPKNLKIKRLVLTAPVDTYRSYRAWLNKEDMQLLHKLHHYSMSPAQ